MIDYTHRIAFDVLTAPLAEIDRRTLSQAWYSALHLAAVPAESPSPRARGSRPVSPAPVGATRPVAARALGPMRGASVAKTSRASEPAGTTGLERRSPRSELARRIERVVGRPLPEARGASFALRGPHGRVQILLRSVAGRTHLVAICAQEARSEVARALDQARYALARGGIGTCAVRVLGDVR